MKCNIQFVSKQGIIWKFRDDHDKVTLLDDSKQYSDVKRPIIPFLESQYIALVSFLPVFLAVFTK